MRLPKHVAYSALSSSSGAHCWRRCLGRALWLAVCLCAAVSPTTADGYEAEDGMSGKLVKVRDGDTVKIATAIWFYPCGC